MTIKNQKKMKIHHIRNATLIIETEDQFILVDPMLDKIGEGGRPPLTFSRVKRQLNPLVNLPSNAMKLVEKTTHCLITHLHPDHLDKTAEKFLSSKNIPVTCSIKDQDTLRKRGLNVTQTLDYWQQTDFLGGKIEGIPARHGYGFVAKPAGNVMGFYIELPNQDSIYISSDTIYTDDVDKVLNEYQPAINVVAGGAAQFSIFKPLLMTIKDILRFAQNAPGKVIVNHMESLGHCPMTRAELKEEIAKVGLSEKVIIPNDGDLISILNE